jgi:hypothetical protein
MKLLDKPCVVTAVVETKIIERHYFIIRIEAFLRLNVFMSSRMILTNLIAQESYRLLKLISTVILSLRRHLYVEILIDLMITEIESSSIICILSYTTSVDHALCFHCHLYVQLISSMAYMTGPAGVCSLRGVRTPLAALFFLYCHVDAYTGLILQ